LLLPTTLYTCLTSCARGLRRGALAVVVLPALALGADEGLKLVIDGGNNTLKNNVRHYLGDLDRLPCDARELHVHNALSRADPAISEALRALGYYHGSWKIDTSRTPARNGNGKNGECWQVSVALTPGDPTLLTDIHAEIRGPGGDDPDFSSVLDDLPLRKDRKLNHGQYDQAKRMIQQRAAALGYFASEYRESVLRVNRETHSATAVLIFDSGPRYRFGAINYPDTVLKQSFLERYQTFASGDPYDVNKVIGFQNNLINSQYFDIVSVNQREPDPDTATVDIDLELAVKSRYESTFGTGFSTNLGPKASYVLKNRRYNSDGDTYQISTQWSPVESNVGFQYEQPGADPLREKTLWSAGWRQEDSDSVDSTAFLGEVSRVTMLDNGWMLTRSLSVLNEDFRVADSEGSTTSFLVYPGVQLARSRANDARYPTRGWRVTAGVKGASEDLLSDTSFVQTTLDGKFILPLGGGRLISRGGFGATWVDAFATLPASLRFFAGGDSSVRGFDYQSLGPRNSAGEVTGGKNLITGSVEYDYLVWGDYGVAVFYDTGSAFDTRQFKLYESAGFGLRWLSPIGPIRVDFAFPLADGGFRFHLSMGPDL